MTISALASLSAGIHEFARSYCDFIAASPTAYHAAHQISQILSCVDFRQQHEQSAWHGYRQGFVVRDGAVIAWKMPNELTDATGVRIIGSHTDSPSFHLKPAANTSAYGYEQVNVEVYGGPLLNSWLNRDLGLAGRIVLMSGEEKLVCTDAIMTIPQIAPHLDRSVNKELKLSAQRDYHPIWSISGGSIADVLADAAHVNLEQIAAADIFAYAAEAPRIFGGSGSDFVAAARQDNLSSVMPGLAAFIEAQPSTHIQIYAAMNNEEIGSQTYSGAAGGFMESVLRRLIHHHLGEGSEIFERTLALSSCVSADAAHAVNPNRPELHDPEHQHPLGSGPVMKIHASGAYASNALTQAILVRAAAKSGVPLQQFVSNNDVTCGTTIGPLTATRLGIATVDCGVPLLSMHSVRELSSPSDLKDFALLLHAYLES